MDNREEKFELMKSIYFYLRRFQENINDEVNHYRKGKYTIDNNNLIEIIDNLKQALKAIDLTRDCHNIKDTEEEFNRLAVYTEEIVEALDNIDFTTIADILEYEISPMTEEWRTELAVSLKLEN